MFTIETVKELSSKGLLYQLETTEHNLFILNNHMLDSICSENIENISTPPVYNDILRDKYLIECEILRRLKAYETD